MKTRRIILRFIKSKLYQLFSFNINNNTKDKLFYIIKKSVSSEYYLIKYIKFHKLKEIYEYYKEFYLRTKKEEILFIENNIIKKKEKKIVDENLLKDFNIAKKINERASIIKYIYIPEENDKKKKKNYDLYKYIEKWEKLENIINDKQFKKIKRTTKLKLAYYFTNDNNKQEIGKIFKIDIYKFIKQKSIEFLNEEKNNNKININDISKENNKIDINKKSSSKKEKDNKKKENKNLKSQNDDTNIIIESVYIFNSSSFNDSNFSSSNQNVSKNKYLEYVKVIGKHENSVEFIKELNNKFFISGGSDKSIYIYDINFKLFYEIKKKEWIYNAFNFEKNTIKGTEIIVCCKNDLSIFQIDNDNTFKNIKSEIENYSYLNVIEFKNYEHLFLTNKGIEMVTNLNSKILSNRKVILLNEIYKGGILINEHEAVLTSNKILYNGQDKLIFYSILEKKFKDPIKGYSFINTVNGLTLIIKEENECRILLCACKKYISGQKNGILTVNILKNGEKLHNFYETRNFEVFCFCPITLKEKNYILNDERNKRYNTDCFLVGGFDNDKQRGAIKLYQLENEKNIFKIKFINNIDFEDFIEFKNPISCINQFKSSDNLMISSLEGNVSLFKLDLDYIISVVLIEKIEIMP